MNRRVLLVDDEPALLETLQRQLCFDFDLSLANSGAQALELMDSSEKFAVVLSDMRMPKMDGINFLKQAKARSEQTVRMMLTGNADQKTAVDALNDGCIFRFMNKPCSIDVVRNSLQAGLEQYQLVMAEQDLFSQTLLDSAKLLTELLAIADPVAFGRTSRISRWSKQCAVQLELARPWEVELAAVFSQIGSLSAVEELPLADDGPLVLEVSQRLVSQIPRLDNVARIIAFDLEAESRGRTGQPDQAIDMSAQIFGAAVAIDNLLIKEGMSEVSAIKKIRDEHEVFCDSALDALASVILTESRAIIQTVAIHCIPKHAILAEDICSLDGVLLLSKGQQLSEPLCQRLLKYSNSGRIKGKISILGRENS